MSHLPDFCPTPERCQYAARNNAGNLKNFLTLPRERRRDFRNDSGNLYDRMLDLFDGGARFLSLKRI